jgi:hypothetical protein
MYLQMRYPVTAMYTCFLIICCQAANVIPLFISRSLPGNRSTHYIAPSLRLFVPNGLQHTTISSFLMAVLVMYVISLTFLLLWLGFHGDYCPTAPAAPFLKPLVTSSSLIRCQLVQVDPHHPAFPIGGGKSSSVVNATSPPLTLFAGSWTLIPLLPSWHIHCPLSSICL